MGTGLETGWKQLAIIHRHNWKVSVNLKDMYLQVPVHPLKPLVSSFRLGGLCAPVHGPLLRPIHSSLGIHQDHGSCFSRVTQAGHSVPLISRQLASLGIILPRGPQLDPDPATAICPSGNSHQLQQVVPTTSSGAGLPGSQHSDFSLEGFPNMDVDRQPSLSSLSFLGFTTTDRQEVAKFARSHGVPNSLGPWGSVADVESAVSPLVSVFQLYTG